MNTHDTTAKCPECGQLVKLWNDRIHSHSAGSPSILPNVALCRGSGYYAEPTRAAEPAETAPTPETLSLQCKALQIIADHRRKGGDQTVFEDIVGAIKTIKALQAERDEAIRERDEARAKVKELEHWDSRNFGQYQEDQKTIREITTSRDALASQVATHEKEKANAIAALQKMDRINAENKSLASQVGALRDTLKKIIKDGDGCYSRELAQEALGTAASGEGK